MATKGSKRHDTFAIVRRSTDCATWCTERLLLRPSTGNRIQPSPTPQAHSRSRRRLSAEMVTRTPPFPLAVSTLALGISRLTRSPGVLVGAQADSVITEPQGRTCKG